jgi:hypothetical protein
MMPSASFGIISPAAIEAVLAAMSLRQIALLFVTGLFFGALMMGAAGVVIRWALRPITKKWIDALNTVSEHAEEWSRAFDRIPPQGWFDDVAEALRGIAGQASELGMHAKNLLEIEDAVRRLEAEAKADHVKLTLLKHDHDLAGVFGRRATDKGGGCTGLPAGDVAG